MDSHQQIAMLSSFLAIAAIATIVGAAPIEPVPILVNFTVNRNSTAGQSSLERRSDAAGLVSVALENQWSRYTVNIDVGTPGQSVPMVLDTATSDLWVAGVESGSDQAVFDKSKSSSLKKIGSDFSIWYFDDSGAGGDWITEDLTIGKTSLKDVRMGYATNEDVVLSGRLGLGYRNTEVTYLLKGYTYDNFPRQLKKQGKINKVAYSLYLNSPEAESGSILFGGIDHAKYSGDLALLDVIRLDISGGPVVTPSAFWVPLEGISQNESDLMRQRTPALLDSASPFISAPEAFATSFPEKIGATFRGEYGLWTINCDAKVDDITFDFGKTKVTVPGKNLLLALGPDQTPNTCAVGVITSPSDYYILGDLFLRSAYAYFDMEDNKVGLAQAKYTDASDIELVRS